VASSTPPSEQAPPGVSIEAVQARRDALLEKIRSKLAGAGAGAWPDSAEVLPGGGPAPGASTPPSGSRDLSPLRDELGGDAIHRAADSARRPLDPELLDDAPPEAIRLIRLVMLRGGTPSNLITVLRGAGFVIRRIEQSPDLL
jgi:hypothetical protein